MTSVQSIFSKGLEDVIAAESSISVINGKESKLFYRGYDIHDLAQNSTFEETTHLLLFGELPTAVQLTNFKGRLASERGLPGPLVDAMHLFPKNVHPMAALRSAVSLRSFYDTEADDQSAEACVRKAIRLIAQIPVIVTYFDRIRNGRALIAPEKSPAVSAAANFLFMLRGREASDLEIKMLDKYLILLAEHDLNASTFAARITASTLSDVYSGIVSAIGTLKGDLHGSANSRAMESLVAIGSVDRVESFVDDALGSKRKLMGFGHRIYKGPDPRAEDLRVMSKTLSGSGSRHAQWYAISEKLEQTVWNRRKLYCNVDFYSASVLYILGVPTDLFTTIFAMSRMAGWTAHILEQYSNNRLIRPVSLYRGQPRRSYIPIDRRS